MKRVAVFQGLGVAVPNESLPPGVWQHGQPTPATQSAIWFRTENIVNKTQFPQTNPAPAANCVMCPPGDMSPECCPSSDYMPQYTDWGERAYRSSYKPWDHNSMVAYKPPTTSEVIAVAMDQSLRQSKLEMASPENDGPPDPQLQLAGFLGNGGQWQNHLLGKLGNGQGQQHLLGYANRYSPFGCTSCKSEPVGGYIVSNNLGGLGTVMILGGVSLAASIVGAVYWAKKGKKASKLAKVSTFALPVTAAVLYADVKYGK